MVQVVMQSRYDWIEQAIQECADGKLPFDDLCQKVAAAGFKTTSLHEMVRAAEIERAVR